MQLPLLGGAPSPAQIAVRLYCDEIRPYRNRLGEHWMYIGLLAIPEARYECVLERLLEDRQQAAYWDEVHFSQLRNYSYAHCHNKKTLLARYWLERVLWDTDKVFHFHLLGLNRGNLQPLAFGAGRTQERRIYNRFFRALVAGMLKHCFPGKSVTVSRVFHDVSELQHDDLFEWHTIWRLDSDTQAISFVPRQIDFIDSDHRRETRFSSDSHLIQLCDLLLGGLTQCLDARNVKDGCCEIASLLLPLAERLTDPLRAENRNSRYRYWRRISMSFFPSKQLSLQELAQPYLRLRSRYYSSRRLLFAGHPGAHGDTSVQLALPMPEPEPVAGWQRRSRAPVATPRRRSPRRRPPPCS